MRFEALGRCVPVGYAVMNPDPVGSVAVTFNTTAPTPDAGTPPRPTTVRSTLLLWPGAPPPAKTPSIVVAPLRVSNKRAGSNDVNDTSSNGTAVALGAAIAIRKMPEAITAVAARAAEIVRITHSCVMRSNPTRP